MLVYICGKSDVSNDRFERLGNEGFFTIKWLLHPRQHRASVR
jgi:hypothetical protein